MLIVLSMGMGIGCLSAPPEITYYDLMLTPPAPVEGGEVTNAPPPGKDDEGGESTNAPPAIQVVAVRVPEHLDDHRIFYRSSRIEAGHYEYHRWIRPPSEALADAMVRYLEAAQCFGPISDPLDPLNPDAVHVKIRVEDLNEEDFSREDATPDEDPYWHARVSLHITISNLPGRPDAARWIREIEPVGKRNAKGVAIAINSALDRALTEAVRFVCACLPPRTGSDG